MTFVNTALYPTCTCWSD